MIHDKLVSIFDLPINKGIMLAYTGIIGGVLTLDLEAKTLFSLLGVVVVNLIALLKWGVKIEKAVSRNEDRVEMLIQHVENLADILGDETKIYRGKKED